MALLVENQPDAYTYRVFGRRILRGTFLAALILTASALLIGAGTSNLEEIATFMMEGSDIQSEGIEGQIMKIFFVISAGFMPLTWTAMHLARSYKKGYKRLDLERSGPSGLVTGARVALLLMSTLAVAPIAMAFDAPATVINYYQEWFLQVFFTLFGLGLLLLMVAPTITLQRRIGGKGLYLAGLFGLLAGGLIIYHANLVWSASVFDLAAGKDLEDFSASYQTVMLSVAGLLCLSGLMLRRNAGTILRQQRRHFITHLEG